MISDFIAIDFETAYPGKAPPPCSLGVTVVKNSVILSSTNFYINPETPISPLCQNVHGISNQMVKNCPTFPHIWETLHPLVAEYPIIAHNAVFDIGVLLEAASRYKIIVPRLHIYDTMLLSKKHVGAEKNNLPFMCKYFGIDCRNHHKSSDDSEMCARLFLELQARYGELEEFEMPLPAEAITVCPDEYDWDDFESETQETQTHHFFSSQPAEYVEADVKYDDPEGFSFAGKVFVLTGQIGDYDRSKLVEMICLRGGEVRSSISKKVDYLIVGYEDRNIVSDSERAKSTKIIKAEQLREAGGKIKILPDEFFLEVIGK